MKAAQLAEKKLGLLQLGRIPIPQLGSGKNSSTSGLSTPKPFASLTTPKSYANTSPAPVSPPTQNTIVQTRSTNPYRRMTESEIQNRRERGLCYRCDEKYSFGHRCKQKQLQQLEVLMVHDPEEESTGQEGEPSDEVANTVELGVAAELSINSVIGFTEPHTMRLEGSISGEKVIVLIDCGATHNFISMELVRKLKLPIATTTEYGVSMGNGLTVQGDGICKAVTLNLQNLSIVEEFLPIDLGGTDVVLGMKWLESLGDMHVNWQLLTMRFNISGINVTLKGDPSLGRSLISLKAMVKLAKNDGPIYWVECHQLTTTPIQPGLEIPAEIEGVIQKFPALFESPKGLPPPRQQDHTITLKNGAAPISVRPYRYPQVQKNEIEKLVKEMLAGGIIRPSSSPFSSPVLLVKKRWKLAILR